MRPLTFNGSVNDRLEVINPLVKSGKILDLGVVDSRRMRHETSERLEAKANLLFRQICKINPKTLGVDIDDAGIDILREEGYHVRTANVMTMNLGEQFDVIVAGEIIEHLDNPGQFLQNMRRHLRENGTLVISTPNPFYIKQFWKIWRYNRPQVHEEHTCWFDPLTLSYLNKLRSSRTVSAI
jgi:SAM-dependent methyltransferase